MPLRLATLLAVGVLAGAAVRAGRGGCGVGREGDELYDQAATLVQKHLVDLGQDPMVWLPQAAT